VDEKDRHMSVSLRGALWDAGAEAFVNQSVNGHWVEVLTTNEAAEYKARAVEQLGFDCARWLAIGDQSK
jgi:aryl sulfotransferase